MNCRWTIAILFLAVSLLTTVASGQEKASPRSDEEKPSTRPYTISKETTYFTGPLKPDGSVDFIAAVNEHFSRGVTPENNAARIVVPLLPAERWSTPEQRTKVLKALDLDPLDHSGRGLCMEQLFQDPSADWEKFKTDLDIAISRPWTQEEFPILHAWLHENAFVFERITSAARMPRYYVPLLGDEKTGLLMTALLDDAQILRFVGRSFVIRANNHLAEGRFDEAWSDTRTLLDMGRLVGQGQSWVHSTVGTYLSELACAVAKRYLVDAPINETDWRQRLDDWPTEPYGNLRDQIDVMDRAMFVQICCQAWDEPERTLWLSGEEQDVFTRIANQVYVNTLREMFETRAIDLDEAFQIVNPLFDKAVIAIDETDIAKRQLVLNALEDRVSRPDSTSQFFWPKNGGWGKSSATSSYVDYELWTMFPAVSAVLASRCRGHASRQCVEMALAARLIQSKNGRLPSSLEELNPSLEPSVMFQPLDGKRMGFKQSEDGILIYHWYHNRKDDGGDIDGDNPKDWGIRLR